MPPAFRPNRLTNYDEDSILAEIRRVITQHFDGQPPSSKDFNKFSMVKGWLIRQRFGSYANGIEKAGFKYVGKNWDGVDLRREKYSEELMIADLQRVKNLNSNHYFSQNFYQANGGQYSHKTLKKHFGCSWATLLLDRLALVSTAPVKLKIHYPGRKRISEYSDEALTPKLKRRSRATPESLLADLRNVVGNEAISTLTFDRYRQLGGSYSIGTFQHHFGSWKTAVAAVGYVDGHSAKYDDEYLFSEMQRLWEMYGRQPTFKDMNRDGKISGGVFQRRFGSWMKAIHAFCADRQSPDQEEIATVEIPLVEAVHAGLSTEGTAIPNLEFTATNSQKTILVDKRRCAGRKLSFQVFMRDNFTCVYCKRSRLSHNVDLEADHITPWSQGGLTVIENLQTTCKECNRDKSDLLLHPC